jgi:hypothetical protein
VAGGLDGVYFTPKYMPKVKEYHKKQAQADYHHWSENGQ